MSYQKLIGKVAVDKDSNALGRIVRIEKLIGKTVKVYKAYAMVHVEKRFKKDILVPIECELMLKVEGLYVWFNITKEEFTEEEKRIRTIKTERAKYDGNIPERSISGRMWMPYDPTGTSYKKKERKH
ncbi:MAG: hypothetical protein FK734_14465 [Asgard group archaeon]|nr:hypothetical protein [Asgard group archaeon]